MPQSATAAPTGGRHTFGALSGSRRGRVALSCAALVGRVVVASRDASAASASDRLPIGARVANQHGVIYRVRDDFGNGYMAVIVKGSDTSLGKDAWLDDRDFGPDGLMLEPA